MGDSAKEHFKARVVDYAPESMILQAYGSSEKLDALINLLRPYAIAELVRSVQEACKIMCGCVRCGSVTTRDRNPCQLCTSTQRNGTVMCVVEDPSDIALLEKSGGYHGRYHALMGRLSPMKGVGPGHLRIQALLERLVAEGIREVILALSTDVEGEATSSYLADMLKARGLTVTRLAYGLPAGSGIAYADGVTLTRAIQGRQSL